MIRYGYVIHDDYKSLVVKIVPDGTYIVGTVYLHSFGQTRFLSHILVGQICTIR